MPTVTNTIKLPDGSSPTHAAVVIELVASTTGRAPGWVTANDNTILSVARPAVTNGAWSAVLVANDDIDPAGTVYKVTETADKVRYVHHIEVPSGGGALHDLLTTAPTTIPPTHSHAAYLPVLGEATYTYDADGNVLTEIVNGTTTTFTYDADGNIATATRSGIVYDFTYDSDGNLLTIEEA